MRTTRRALLLAAAVLLATCGSDDEKTLRLAIWSSYIPDDVVTEFEREQGCRVEVWNYGANEELLARLRDRDSGFDVAVPSDFVLGAMVAGGMLEPIDLAKLPNASHLDAGFRRRPSDPEDRWSLPYTWGTVGLAWLADKMGETVDSWDAIADPRVAKQVFLLEEGRDAIGAALLRNGFDPSSTDPAHLASAKETLLRWKPNLKGFTGEVKKTLEDGDAWLCQAYNGDAAQARRTRATVRYAVPKEGGILWVDTLVLPKGASSDLAHRFLDFVFRPAIAARISNGVRYAVANRDALPLVDAAVRDDPAVYAPEDVRRRCRQQRDLGPAEEVFSRIWLEVRGGG